MIQADTTWTISVPAKADGSLDEAQKIVNTVLTTESGIAGFFGMGFMAGEDFDVDLYVEVNSLSINNLGFGGQLTYRFN